MPQRPRPFPYNNPYSDRYQPSRNVLDWNDGYTGDWRQSWKSNRCDEVYARTYMKSLLPDIDNRVPGDYYHGPTWYPWKHKGGRW